MSGVQVFDPLEDHDGLGRVPHRAMASCMDKEEMKILHPVDGDGPQWLFWCPGCKCAHGIWTRGPVVWEFDGDLDHPTVKPSLLARGTEFTEVGQEDYLMWRASGFPDRKGKAFDNRPSVCHVVITKGVLNFCSDCTHGLAGKSVPMEPF